MTTEQLFIQEYHKIDKMYRAAQKEKSLDPFKKVEQYILEGSSYGIELPYEMVASLHDTFMHYHSCAKDEMKEGE